MIIDSSNTTLHQSVKNILIEDGIITKITNNEITQKTDAVIEKVFVSRGWVDSSVCFGEPGFEERETIANGLETASRSGFTHVMVNPNTHPVNDNKSTVMFIKEQSKNHLSTAYPIGALTQNSNGETLAELYDMKQGGAVAFGDYKKAITNSNMLKIALQYTQNFGGIVISFPNEPKIAGKGVVNEHVAATRLGLKGIPALAEELCVARDLSVLEYTGGKLHIPTVSTAKSLQLIREAKAKGLDVSCSVAVHNIHFTDEILSSFDTNFKVLPPLRDIENVKAIRKALLDGTVDFVTSDHNPLDVECKLKEFDHAAYGTIGLEAVFGILNQYVSVDRAIELLTNAGKRFGIVHKEIKEGTQADVTVFNPNETYRLETKHIYSTSKNCAFLGEQLKGRIIGTIANHKIIIN